ncbi:MerR family transcriptional regulator [Pelagicoccus mobilis]|uniref:MerR family transcriptional regulator n=1 Tax=Pelagicoccus mobilis TaxID=415221 RepID=A0A934S710_9BACT|nr:MerR family transcriptional regulator [Pelagicoccus mobilis]MBK1880098.1 MerR family transcriptional regulator [Pelagicoccus mobilis]
MNQNETNSEQDTGQFEVGAVARMVGLSPNTLRTWERRNFIQAANRTPSGRRRYTATQVEQIALLKKLTESGDSIGSIAHLDLESLRKRTLEFQTRNTETSASQNRIVNIHAVGSKAVLWTSILPPNFKISQTKTEDPDLIVCELSSSIADCRQDLAIVRHEYPNVPVAVIYDFAPRGAISELSNKNIFLIHAPCSPELLAHYIHAAIAGSTHQSTPTDAKGSSYAKRLFSERQLAQIANSNPSIKCECPHHISALVASLVSFEKYCEHCEIEAPSDAEIHTHLGKEIAKARGIVEEALLYLCTKDNIPIPQDSDQ